MKKYFIIASALLLAACAKEAPIQDAVRSENSQSDGLVTYTFYASINATKAYIDDSTVDGDGVSPLKWESGDQIALYNATTDSYVTFSTTESGTTATFTGSAPAGARFTKAYYPVDYCGESVATYYATKYSGISATNSKKSFAMEVASIEEGASSINFTQKGSLIKFSVSNVPSFTRKAKLVFGSLTETVAISEDEAETGSMVVYFAIPAGTNNLTFSLEDSASTPNTFYTKTRESAKLGYTEVDAKDVETSQLYRYTINLGPVITFSGTGVSTINKMKLTQCIGDGYGSNNVTWDLHTNGTTKYIVLPYAKSGYYDWIEPGSDAVQVDVYNADAWKAQCRYIYVRDTNFTITTDNTTLSTEYRVYPYGTTQATSLYATYATGTYNTPTNYTFSVSETSAWSDWTGDWYWYSAGLSSDWCGTKFNHDGSFTIPSASVMDNNFILVINAGGGDAKQTEDLALTLGSNVKTVAITLGDYNSSSGKRKVSSSISEYATEILEEPLGVGAGYDITIPKTFDATKYVPIPVSYVGKTLNFVFKGGDSDVNWNAVTINRDFYYSF